MDPDGAWRGAARFGSPMLGFPRHGSRSASARCGLLRQCAPRLGEARIAERLGWSRRGKAWLGGARHGSRSALLRPGTPSLGGVRQCAAWIPSGLCVPRPGELWSGYAGHGEPRHGTWKVRRGTACQAIPVRGSCRGGVRLGVARRGAAWIVDCSGLPRFVTVGLGWPLQCSPRHGNARIATPYAAARYGGARRG